MQFRQLNMKNDEAFGSVTGCHNCRTWIMSSRAANNKLTKVRYTTCFRMAVAKIDTSARFRACFLG